MTDQAANGLGSRGWDDLATACRLRAGEPFIFTKLYKLSHGTDQTMFHIISRSEKFVVPPSGGLAHGHDLRSGRIRCLISLASAPREPPEGGTTNMVRILALFSIC